MSPQKLEFEACSGAIRGSRADQEDASRIWSGKGASGEPELLLLAADGLGGHASGEIASNTACDAFVEAFAAGSGTPGLRLRAALDAGNAAIRSRIKSDAALSGMGTTLVAAHIDESGMRWVSVGDSSAMLFRDGKLRRINEDHSLGALLDRQVAAGKVAAEEARANPKRGALRSALAGDTIALVDLKSEPLRLQAGDWVLLASDGLDTLGGNAIARIISETGGNGAKAVVDALLAQTEAAKRPDQDNATVVAVAVREAPVTRIISHARATGSTAVTRRISAPSAPVSAAHRLSPALVAALAALLIVGAAAAGYYYRDRIASAPSGPTETSSPQPKSATVPADPAKAPEAAAPPASPAPAEPQPPAEAAPKRPPDAPRDRPRGGQRP